MRQRRARFLRLLTALSAVLPLLVVASLLPGQATTAPSTQPAKPVLTPQRWEKEIEKFEEADREQMPAPGGIEFVGSSTIRMWDLNKWFPELHPLNRGFGGSFMEDSAYFARRIVTKYNPATIVLYAGDNDIAEGRTPQDVLTNLDRFVSTVRSELPEARIIVLSIKPCPSRWKWIGQVREANRLMKDFAAAHERMSFVDMEPLMLDESGRPRKELFRDDMLHLSEQGYRVWSTKLRAVLESGR